MEKRNKKYCSWCGKPTAMEEIMIGDSPILEFMEEKINKYGRDKIWGEQADWSRLNLDPDFEAELLVYDQMISTVTNKVVCITCLKEDDDLYTKYYDDCGDDEETEIIFDEDY